MHRIHPLLSEHPTLVAAEQAQQAAKAALDRPNAEYRQAMLTWEQRTINAFTTGDTPPEKPEPPLPAVIRALQRREADARQAIEVTTKSIAPEVEEALLAREADLLAEVEQIRARLVEIADEGMKLGHAASRLGTVTGQRGPGGGWELSPDTLIDVTTRPFSWVQGQLIDRTQLARGYSSAAVGALTRKA